MATTVGDLRNRKLTKLFRILDADGDGAVSVGDYELFGERLARVSGQTDAARIAEMKATLKMIWDEFQSKADGDHDGIVSEKEFVESIVRPQVGDPIRFAQFVGLTCNLLFGIADTDHNGRISKAEHTRIGTEVLRLSDAEAANSFAKLDFWKKGYLTMDQYVIAYTQFLTSDVSLSNGNWLFGDF
ncbi:EF-hand domain-containing protein [Nocardia sp. NPDC051570]|uniref:EF-hand domain-containing protein n=1 Tax=Nocardia sp. NPDC051570 TaxID=3364324 RepID=UPI0037B3F245